jgi:hypothetical protein
MQARVNSRIQFASNESKLVLGNWTLIHYLSLDSGCYGNQARWKKPQNSVPNFVCAHQPTIMALGAKKEY